MKSIRIDIAGDDSRARLIQVRICFFCTTDLFNFIGTVLQRFLDDLHARKQLQHENLLSPIGFSSEFSILPAMVFPWMHNGSLTTYLEQSAELTIESKLWIVCCFPKTALAHSIH